MLVVYANYDLTFPSEYSLRWSRLFAVPGLQHEVRVLPCGHYTTGETPYKFIDGWYMGWFVYRAFKALREENAAGRKSSLACEQRSKKKPSRVNALRSNPSSAA